MTYFPTCEKEYTGMTSTGAYVQVVTVDMTNAHGGLIAIKNTDPANNLLWKVDSYANWAGTIPCTEKNEAPVAPGMIDFFPFDGKVRSKYIVNLMSEITPAAYRIEVITGD